MLVGKQEFQTVWERQWEGGAVHTVHLYSVVIVQEVQSVWEQQWEGGAVYTVHLYGVIIVVQEVQSVWEQQWAGGAGCLPHPRQGGGKLECGGTLRDPCLADEYFEQPWKNPYLLVRYLVIYY